MVYYKNSENDSFRTFEGFTVHIVGKKNDDKTFLEFFTYMSKSFIRFLVRDENSSTTKFFGFVYQSPEILT